MKINKILAIVIAILIPFIILIGAVRVLLIPSLAAWEYNRPGFPPDPFGFSLEERGKWSYYAISYLVNNEGVEYLGDLTDEAGMNLFNPSELKHMLDVKEVVQGALTVWYVMLGLLFAFMLWFVITRNWKTFTKAINWGGWSTIILIAAFLVFLALNFNQLFEKFHQLFFEEGTWLFSPSDTLIRLFPLEFWRDAFIAAGAMSIITAIILVIATRTKKN